MEEVPALSGADLEQGRLGSLQGRREKARLALREARPARLPAEVLLVRAGEMLPLSFAELARALFGGHRHLT
jgi:hypothetical protein